MVRKNLNGRGFTAIRVQGGLLPPESLQTIAALDASFQNGSDYGFPSALSMKDEIARYWRIANDIYEGYAARRGLAGVNLKKASNDEWLVPLFSAVLGYSDLEGAGSVCIEDRTFPLTHTACGGSLPVLLTTPDHDLETADSCFGEEGRRRSPLGLIQELLNGKNNWLWGIVSNGTRVRLLRDNPSLTRPAFLEADLDLIFQEQLYPDFVLFWLIFHASRLSPLKGKEDGQCIIEQWRNRSHEEGQRALDHLRDGVTEALRILGNGFLGNQGNIELKQALAEGTLDAMGFFEELLRLVYRLLFLFTAEERNLLHCPDSTEDQRRLYRQGYSLQTLRERALKRRHYDRHGDLWKGINVLFSVLKEGAPALGLSALGGLFGSEQCPYLERATISNERFLEAVRSLAYFRSDFSLARVNYRDMGAEELGSVYESLLELAPYVDVDSAPWAFGFVGEGESSKGSVRKLTGSYYTPATLVNELIRTTLEPVMAEAVRNNPQEPRQALLALRIVDPACGSGHFLLAAARRMSIEIARLEAGSDTPDEQARQHAFREVVQYCIFGVDRNPLAVELCRTALWIESVEPGKPLTFLDPHIQCGDSLVGILDPKLMEEGIPDEAYNALTGDSRSVCTKLKRMNSQFLKERTGSLFVGDEVGGSARVVQKGPILSSLPEDDIDQIEEKRRIWEENLKSPERLRGELCANLFVGSFFAEKKEESFPSVPTNEDLFAALAGKDIRSGLKTNVLNLATKHRFFHWFLSFAEVMGRGGFDVVIGNPPWERIKLQEQEFFANRSRWIAEAPNAAERSRRIKELKRPESDKASKILYQAFQDALHESEASSSFIRKGGRFPLTGVGDVNTYAVFAETFLNLSSISGRSGFVVPTGIATDSSTKAFFSAIVNNKNLASLYDFENREKIFPAVDSRIKFCLLTLGHEIIKPNFVFFATRVDHLSDDRRRFTLSTEDVERINPNTRTAPVFRSNADAELTRKIYSSVPILIDENKGPQGNPWGISFMRMFDMSNDSGLFRTYRQLEEQGLQREGANWVEENGKIWVPVYEAKMVDFYDHRAASYMNRGDERGYRVLPESSFEEHADSQFEVQTYYWVLENELKRRIPDTWHKKWLLGFKNVTSPTNERTFICSLIPLFGVGHSMPLIFPSTDTCVSAYLLCNLSSLFFDYLVRQKLGGINMTYFNIKQFPVFPPSTYGIRDRSFIIPRVLELAFTSEAMRPFAEDLGYQGPPFRWDPERRAYLKAELDAYYARLYGLTRNELRYILDPSDVKGEDYPSETFRVLKKNEIHNFGEYRTARLVLQAWDRQEESHND